MTRLTEVFVLLFVMLAGPSFSLRTDGVVVQAADPRGPDYFRTDLGSTATLQCPGVLGFSMPINSVSWFRGNSTSAAVILDDRTAVSSDGMLVIQTVKKAESGWYSCQYDSPGGPVTGRAHLNVIELEITIHIIDRSTGQINSLPGMQQGMINIKENQIVALDAKSTRGDHLPDRDPYWLFKGENAALRRPYFCYTGFISQNGDSILRMVMLSSVANFSGRYDFIAGGLSTYINVTIRGRDDLKAQSCTLLHAYCSLSPIAGNEHCRRGNLKRCVRQIENLNFVSSGLSIPSCPPYIWLELSSLLETTCVCVC
eukprot:scpid69272/ scgid1775/ Protein sidekick